MTQFDVDKTTYHQTENRIWRIDSGIDLADIWNIDVFEYHAKKYIPEEEHEDRITRTTGENDIEKIEAEFDDRGYRLFKEGDEFTLLFYKDVDEEIDDPASLADEIWEREIDTMLTETAKSKLMQRYRMKNSENPYDRRLAG